MQRTPAAAAFALSAVALALGSALSACSDGPDRSEGRYCTEVGTHLAALNSPAIGSQADVEAMLDEWRTVASAAPLAVQPEWEALVANLETAATVDPADEEAVQALVDAARQNEPAANRVIDYTQRLCGVTIGAVKPVVTTTTPAPATTTTTG